MKKSVFIMLLALFCAACVGCRDVARWWDEYTEKDEDEVLVTITTNSLPDGTVGQAYSASLQADGGTTPYTWSVAAGDLPSGLALDGVTGEITGTPVAQEYCTFTVGVTDALGNCGSRNFSIRVNIVTITTESPLPDGIVGKPYSVTLAATGGTAPYTWSLEEFVVGDLPPGLSLNGATGQISGTPDTSGTYTFTIRVTDAASSYDRQEFSITVSIVAITTDPDLPEARLWQYYSVTLGAAGGAGSYSWAITSGSLPPGLTLNESTGEISGTPETEGTFSFTITLTDGEGNTYSREFTITVKGVAITTASPLPESTVGEWSSTTLQAENGVVPYTWSVTSGALPPGLFLDEASGVISGTPTADCTSAFTVGVADSSGSSDSKAFSMTVKPGSSSGEVTIYADQADFTGYIYNVSTKYSGDARTANGVYRAWMKFNLTALPAGAAVTKVTVHWYVSNSDINTFAVKVLSQDPVTSDAATIWNDTDSGTTYLSSVQETSTGWKSHDLGSQARSDLESARSGKGWFGLGLPGDGC